MGYQKLHANWIVRKISKFKKCKEDKFENVPVLNCGRTEIGNYTLKPGRLEEKYIEQLKKDFQEGIKEMHKKNGYDMDRDWDAEIKELKKGLL